MKQRILLSGRRTFHLLVFETEFPERGFVVLIPADGVALEIRDQIGIGNDRLGAAVGSAHRIRAAHIPRVAHEFLRRDFAFLAPPDIGSGRDGDPIRRGSLQADYWRVGIHP